MDQRAQKIRNRLLLGGGLGAALIIAVFLSPFASPNPDGLERVSKDLKFDSKELQSRPAEKLPFYGLFNGYSLRGVPQSAATPLAGLAGTLATFGMAWGIGKLTVRRKPRPEDSRH
jgi:cobalt/nickel transport protein